MATETSNIDDLLRGGVNPSTPPAPESHYDEVTETPEVFYDEPESSQETRELSAPEDIEEQEHIKEKEQDYDDYGNTKSAPKTYTEEEVNERINKAVRDRLARSNNQNQQPSQQQVAQQAQEFEYNPDSSESWEGQLEKFVERTVSKLGQRQAQQQQQVRDEQVQAEFEDKFNRSMTRFSDFRDVVAGQPITDPMTHALRGLTDPAAFIYAASKRHPQELARISQLADPASQIMEMGRLEERMRKTASGTKAPKPISRSREDGTMPTTTKKKEPTIEDLIASADAKRKAQLNQRRGR